jgi:hypothetical protein
MKAFEHYFKSLGMEKEGVTLHNLICNIEQKKYTDVSVKKMK